MELSNNTPIPDKSPDVADQLIDFFAELESAMNEVLDNDKNPNIDQQWINYIYQLTEYYGLSEEIAKYFDTHFGPNNNQDKKTVQDLMDYLSWIVGKKSASKFLSTITSVNGVYNPYLIAANAFNRIKNPVIRMEGLVDNSAFSSEETELLRLFASIEEITENDVKVIARYTNARQNVNQEDFWNIIDQLSPDFVEFLNKIKGEHDNTLAIILNKLPDQRLANQGLIGEWIANDLKTIYRYLKYLRENVSNAKKNGSDHGKNKPVSLTFYSAEDPRLRPEATSSDQMRAFIEDCANGNCVVDETDA